MKGIAHFISGVTAASFCPWSVQAAVDGNPLYFILGGAFGILPDTLDFKFYRFFYKHDIYVEPDPFKADAQLIADECARAIKMAIDEKRTVRLKLSTIRKGADYWQQYRVKFDSEKGEAVAEFGPVVNTGQVPVPNSAPEAPVGRAKLACPIVQTYDTETKVDIFDGPTFSFEPDGKGSVILHFLPWHRNWSHSFTVGAVFAAMGWLIWGWQAAVVIFLGMAAHLIEDQLGLMGSNLFFPITRKRFMGLHLMRSGDSIPNFSVVWGCCLLIFWNLYRYSADTMYHLTFFKLLMYGAVIPMGAYGLLHYVLTRGEKDVAVVKGPDEFDEPVGAA